MPVIIRKIVDDRAKNYTEVAAESWDLRTQIEALEAWLSETRNRLDPSEQWIADVGFTVRLNATGGGPPLSRNLMQLCIESNIEIYLSDLLREYSDALKAFLNDMKSGGLSDQVVVMTFSEFGRRVHENNSGGRKSVKNEWHLFCGRG